MSDLIEMWIIIILGIGFVAMTCWNMVLDTRLHEMKRYIKRLEFRAENNITTSKTGYKSTPYHGP